MLRAPSLLLLCAASFHALGCAGRASPAVTVSLPAAGAPSAAGVSQEPPPAAGAEANSRPTPPPDYIEMEAVSVAPTPQGLAVLLGDGEGSVVLPIFIGGTEALSIDMRLRKEDRERPLTHDLLESILDRVSARIVKVHVDDVRDGVFFGRVFVSHEGRVSEIDARPSDAVALALGGRAPIFVAQRVLREAGIYRDGAGDDSPTASSAPPRRPRY